MDGMTTPPAPPEALRFPAPWWADADSWLNGPFMVEREGFGARPGVQGNFEGDADVRAFSFWAGERFIALEPASVIRVDGDRIALSKGVTLRPVTPDDVGAVDRDRWSKSGLPLWAFVQDALADPLGEFVPGTAERRGAWLAQMTEDGPEEEDMPDGWWPPGYPTAL